MPRHSRKYRRCHRKMRGGSYTSASSYGTFVNGSVDSQWDRTMSQSGPYGNMSGNTIIGAQGQNAQPPHGNDLSLIQSAGKRPRKKGGFLGGVINQAIVPFALLGMQHTYRRKGKGGSKHTRSKRTRKYRRH
jgi:hypothetical protein